jgi:hypothetical protein
MRRAATGEGRPIPTQSFFFDEQLHRQWVAAADILGLATGRGERLADSLLPPLMGCRRKRISSTPILIPQP